MSLKQYIFALIALFIVLITGAQLAFIQIVKQQMSSEVESRSRTLSEQALSLVVDNIDSRVEVRDESPPAKEVLVTIETTPRKVVDIGYGYQFVTGGETRTVRTRVLDNRQTRVVREQLQGELEKIEIRRLHTDSSFAVGFDAPGQLRQHIVQFREQDSAVNRVFNGLIIATAIIFVIGVLLAWYLARHISRPLAHLSSGFKALENGYLGSQVRSEGIREVRDTLNRFNAMSERLQDLQQLERRFQQQEQLAELGEVARGLAHTLRNPINTIGLAIEQMVSDDLDASQRAELAAGVRQKIAHLDNTIKALLSLSASGVDRQASVDVARVIDDIAMEMSMSNGVSVRREFPDSLSMQGAESEIRAILHTLLSNACEASAASGEVSVEARADEAQLSIEIADDGAGIDPAIRDDLFKPHVSTKPEGAGMGLYISRRLCRSHYGGDISLCNRDSRGCLATVTLQRYQQGAA